MVREDAEGQEERGRRRGGGRGVSKGMGVDP